MASMLACVRAPRASAAPMMASRGAIVQRVSSRGLHQSAVALAKKKRKSTATDDPFADEEDMFGFTEADDLFASSSSSSKQGSLDQASTSVDTTSAVARNSEEHRVLYEQNRRRRFDELFKFVSNRIGAHPPLEKFPEQVRTTAWQQLFQLATTKEQMEAVVEILPRWRDSKRQFTRVMSDDFVRRCEELHCPTLALKVFSDHPKYGVDLTQDGARRLMHALHAEHSLSDSVTLVALHSVYKLPPISQDLVSCAMLTSACFKAGTEESVTVARAILPALRRLLEGADPKTMAYPPKGTKVSVDKKEKAWLTWTLNKIEKALRKQGEPVDWLRVWRESAGHLQVAT